MLQDGELEINSTNLNKHVKLGHVLCIRCVTGSMWWKSHDCMDDVCEVKGSSRASKKQMDDFRLFKALKLSQKVD